MKYLKILYRQLVYLTGFTGGGGGGGLEILKKTLKMTSQLFIFRVFLLISVKKISRKSTDNKFWFKGHIY